MYYNICNIRANVLYVTYNVPTGVSH